MKDSPGAETARKQKVEAISVPSRGPQRSQETSFSRITNAISSAPGQEEDGDGVNNAIEFLLGGDVGTNDLGKLPDVTMTATDMIVTFERKRNTINGITGLEIEVGTTLTSWPSSYTVGNTTANSDPGVTVTENSPAGFETITLTVPKGAGPPQRDRDALTWRHFSSAKPINTKALGRKPRAFLCRRPWTAAALLSLSARQPCMPAVALAKAGLSAAEDMSECPSRKARSRAAWPKATAGCSTPGCGSPAVLP